MAVLIGNGFDIRNGLPTRYSDFYKEIPNKQENLIYKDIENNKDNWSDFELGLGQLTISNKTGNDINGFIESYNKVLIDLDNYLKMCENMVSIKDDNQLNSAFMNDIAKIFDKLEIDGKKRVLRIMNKDEVINVSFINFNYTNFLDKCIGEQSTFKKNSKTYYIADKVHIHGKTELFPIVGVDNESQLNKTWLRYKEIQYLIKPNLIKGLGYGAYDECERIIGMSNVIYIFGSSLGATDKTWWVQILNWLKLDPNHILIIDQYDFDELNRINGILYLTAKEKIKTNFIRYDVNNIVDNRITKQIFITNNSQLFNYSKYIEIKNRSKF
jgi:hypothetical protein